MKKASVDILVHIIWCNQIYSLITAYLDKIFIIIPLL